MLDGSWTIDPCDYTEVKALADTLELGEVTASILVRRGYGDIEAARAFITGEIAPHDPLLLGDMAVAVERIRAAIAGGQRICVHGDYDVDGACAGAGFSTMPRTRHTRGSSPIGSAATMP